MHLVFFALALASLQPGGTITPLPQAHAHNDYEQARPLQDALAQGFCSVEADIFLVKEELCVAHTIFGVRPGRTLESLYLDPLRARIQAQGGNVYRKGLPFYLLIDVKTEAKTTYAALHAVLARYEDILSVTRKGVPTQKEVTVVVSGNCDRSAIAQQEVRWAAIDGRPGDLDGTEPGALVPWISASWTSLFAWRGTGPLSEDDRSKLRDFVRRAHARGRMVRFWAAPDNEAAWRMLKEAEVDLINTDRLADLARFLRQ